MQTSCHRPPIPAPHSPIHTATACGADTWGPPTAGSAMGAHPHHPQSPAGDRDGRPRALQPWGHLCPECKLPLSPLHILASRFQRHVYRTRLVPVTMNPFHANTQSVHSVLKAAGSGRFWMPDTWPSLWVTSYSCSLRCHKHGREHPNPQALSSAWCPPRACSLPCWLHVEGTVLVGIVTVNRKVTSVHGEPVAGTALGQHMPSVPPTTRAQATALPWSPGSRPRHVTCPRSRLPSPVFRAACPALLSTLSSSVTRFWRDSTLLFMLSASSQFCRKGRISLSSSFSFSAWLSITRFQIKGSKGKTQLELAENAVPPPSNTTTIKYRNRAVTSAIRPAQPGSPRVLSRGHLLRCPHVSQVPRIPTSQRTGSKAQ